MKTIAFLLLCLLLTACQTSPSPPPTAPPTLPPTLHPQEPPPAGADQEFATDFSKHTVPYTEILSGGPPKDGIPALDAPQFVSLAEADPWLEPQEPVIAFAQNGEARAYPLQILMWH
ncbi:MAG: DUF3179 domain-containing protein, partial [Anaerolineales bacterium]|nr:DUF3179 domain-containing protein [Anaerolineales bacterium]